MGDKCEWKQDENGAWGTGCDHLHEFIDGTPFDNDYLFCPYCGADLIQINGEAA